MLLPALAVLQYRWVGQVSEAERERRQRSVQTATRQFREAFDGEVARAVLGLRSDGTTVRDSAWYRYADRYATWTDTATAPGLVQAPFLLDADDGALRLRQWNSLMQRFDVAEWPAPLSELRPQFEEDLAAFTAGRPLDRRPPSLDSDSVLVFPLVNVGPRAQGPDRTRPAAIFGFTVLQLDMEYIQEQFLPELTDRHFAGAAGDGFRVSVLSSLDPTQVIFRSDPEAPTNPDLADAVEPLYTAFAANPFFRRPRDGRRGGNDALRGLEDRPSETETQTRISDRAQGRWMLLVQHEAGSLEAAVAAARRRNLGIGFGVLMLMTVSIGLLSTTSRRAQRLARQQMEFVAGVSHELRTPVAVIRSAAENLAQGVVGSPVRVKRYGEMIESEARRLGDMVERVLQYAGIEAGLGMSTRAPVSPAEVIEGAIDASATAVADADASVHQTVEPNLPPVVGDAAALRSAIQNLIINAVKYGGGDNWVGIRASYVDEGRLGEVRIAVQDHGPGIPADELSHIFEPFYRGRDAVSGQIQGSGLGLSLVKRIVTAHGGQVSVSSQPGAGSTFTISLPVAPPDSPATTVAGTHAARPVEGTGHS